MSWQRVQSAAAAKAWVPQAWRPTASLYCAARAPPLMAWQEPHWVALLMAPVCQLGVAWPPWQLTLEQVSAAGLKAAEAPLGVPVSAS